MYNISYKLYNRYIYIYIYIYYTYMYYIPYLISLSFKIT